jgi:type IV pilus assembly protein PilA
MLQKMTRTNEKGFTLIELMIVIAIIGILAAIAIPNFIAYRNKAFCSAAESDANSQAASDANWFAIPTNTNLTGAPTVTLSGTNTLTAHTLANEIITISVKDGSGRCPTDYQAAFPPGTGKSSWNAGTYTKILNP